ncbi:MAG TPA: hypothetical protein VMX15_05385 [Candidatus Heimdallarchaeota archaeon]|nr:hypothetical protein [Candidatus Heimdallarchaeota archaeon]
MEPIWTSRQLEQNIDSVKVTFEDTGEVLPLTTRPGSASYFFERFVVGENKVQLRLDWSDLDANGQPTLDADFIDRKTGKHRALRGNRRLAHHTESSPGGGRVYEWEFEGLSRQFSVAVAWLASTQISVHTSVSCTGEVIHATDRHPEHG